MKEHRIAVLLALCLSAAVAMAQTGASHASAGATSGQAAQSGASSSSQGQTADVNSTASSSDADMQAKIQDALKNDPMLKNVNLDQVKVDVTTEKVELSGPVNNKYERENIDRVVQSYAGNRKIVDHLTERSAYKGNLANAPTSSTPGGDPMTPSNANNEKKVPK